MGDLHCDPGSDESLTLMKGWIDSCQRSHQRCKMPQQVGGPKRLLHCLPDDSVRLETQNPTQRCDYIALSYCWGDGTAVKKTTMETVDSHHVTKPHRDVTSGVCGARHGPCLRLLDRRGTLVPRHLGRCLRLSWGCCLLQGFEALKDPLFLFIVLSL